MPLSLNQQELQALYRLSQSPDFHVLKKILVDWQLDTSSVADIDPALDVPAQVAGKQQTLKAIDYLLVNLSAGEQPRKPRIDTHE